MCFNSFKKERKKEGWIFDFLGCTLANATFNVDHLESMQPTCQEKSDNKSGCVQCISIVEIQGSDIEKVKT